MYTYLHLYDSFFSKEARKNNLNWLYVDKSIVSTKEKDQKRQLWNDRDHILCKIGMTTKPMVSTRLLEWQNTCKNPVINLVPERIEHLVGIQQNKKTNDISALLQKLNFRNSKNNSSERLSLRTYKDGGFFVDPGNNLNLSDIENKIHKYLWDQYGKGFIYCYGCDPMGHKRHTEWFHLPITDLLDVMKTIDHFCYKYGTANS
ncbi:hypothetical protein RNJ44_04548 [Nakaseomyces bracarensis]|uniref:Bacteriophage T5 Orf172 DNA-binding domain-containing protein n=1 Tax=Nakaseomyces bracarensis TaxID=273131 RepID=A0ABR4NV83_9SACH